MNFCFFTLRYGMLYSRYYLHDCDRMNNKLKKIINTLNNTKISNGKKAFNAINNLGDLFKRKDGYIKSCSHRFSKTLFKYTCYYTIVWDDNDKDFIIFFSKNENDDYYYLVFKHDNYPYIAMYDPNNIMTTIYLFYNDMNTINNFNIYYPSDIMNVFSYFDTCMIHQRYNEHGVRTTKHTTIINFYKLIFPKNE